MRRAYFFLVAFILACVTGCHNLGTVMNNNVTVSVAPTNGSVSTFGSKTFSATVTGSANTAVAWQVNGVTGGNATTGTISASGVYSAPHAISSVLVPANSADAIVTITAVSQANSAASGSTTLTVLTQGQPAQNGAVELGSSGGNINASTVMGGSISCCGGTLGSLVVRGGTNYVLSNNHVMANSDAGSIGDAIIQPGLIDNNCTSTGTATVANLSQFISLENNANPVDAAIAQIVSGKVDTSGNILLLGSTTDANGVPVPGAPHAGSGVSASLGQSVAKVGRSSGLTCSTIASISDAFSVQYFKTCGATTPSFTINYMNQISVAGGEFSVEGDSGSLIVTQSTADPVALLFAGSDTDAAGSPIGDVLNGFTQNSGVPTIVGSAATHQVIGCTLPGPSNARITRPAVAVALEAMQEALAARDTHASQLLTMAGVRGVGVGSSLDYDGQPALILFVTTGTPHSTLPVQVDGVRTRIIETANESASGILSADEAQPFASSEATFAVTSLPPAELARAKAVHTAHVEEWMKQPGVQGFGITSSADSEGEAALMIFLIRGAAHNPIPAVIDGVRTRIRESSRFHAGLDSQQQGRGCSVNRTKPAQAAAGSPAAATIHK